LHVARHVLEGLEGWLLFLEVELGSAAFRLVRDTRHREADGKVWQRASIDIELPGEDAAGSLGTLTFSIPNISRVPLAYVEAAGEILGRPVTVWLQHESSLDAFEPALSWRHKIIDFRATESVATFEAGHTADGIRIPGPLYSREEFPQLLPTAGVRL
jgi:hypothetical protein